MASMKPLRPVAAVRVFLGAVLALAVMAGACSSEDSSPAVTDGTVGTTVASTVRVLTGDITIEGAYELSHIPESRVVVQLEDVSLADHPSTVIAEEAYEGVTILPLTYRLTWTGELDPERQYSVAATVYGADGEMLFWTDTVLTVMPGDTRVDVVIVSVWSSP